MGRCSPGGSCRGVSPEGWRQGLSSSVKGSWRRACQAGRTQKHQESGEAPWVGAGNKGALGRHWVGASAGAPGLGGPPDPPACRPRGVRRGVQVCHAGPELHLPGHVHPRHPAGTHVPRPVSAGPPRPQSGGGAQGPWTPWGRGTQQANVCKRPQGCRPGWELRARCRPGQPWGLRDKLVWSSAPQ